MATLKRLHDKMVSTQQPIVITLSSDDESSNCSLNASSLASPENKRKMASPVPTKRIKLSSTDSEDSTSSGKENSGSRFKMTVGEYIKDTSLLVQKLLGQGGFGMVYQIQRRETGNKFAVKQAEKGRRITLREVEVHNAMSKETAFTSHLLKCLRCIDHDTKTLFVMNLMDADLLGFMENRKYQPVEPTEWLNLAQQIFLGLQQLNELGFIHCDIKPENIMIEKLNNEHLKVKISDFGCALTPTEAKNIVKIGTLNYRAPEMLLGLPKDERLDTWSAGCVLWFMYTGRMIFTANDVHGMIDQLEESFCLPVELNKGVLAEANCRDYAEKVKRADLSQYSKQFLAKAKKMQEKAKKISHNYRSSGKTSSVDDKITNILIRLLQPNVSIRLTSKDTGDLIQQVYKMCY